MIGNAVSVPMAKWIAQRLSEPSKPYGANDTNELPEVGGWPSAAWSFGRKRRSAAVSEWPVLNTHYHLASFLKHPVVPLSKRATSGFLSRLQRSNLRHDLEFAKDLAHHAKNAD
jgi:DNA (cytosine-5)-methyltransferase 1